MRRCKPTPRLESPRSCEDWSAGVQGQIWSLDGSGQADAEMQDEILRTLRPWIDIDRPRAQTAFALPASCVYRTLLTHCGDSSVSNSSLVDRHVDVGPAEAPQASAQPGKRLQGPWDDCILDEVMETAIGMLSPGNANRLGRCVCSPTQTRSLLSPARRSLVSVPEADWEGYWVSLSKHPGPLNRNPVGLQGPLRPFPTTASRHLPSCLLEPRSGSSLLCLIAQDPHVG